MTLSKQQRIFLFIFIASILLIRLFSLGIYDLADTTEARYAAIAMRMVLSGNWITPQYFSEPFWAKPPLSFWATAIFFKLFGFSEFVARLPHFLVMVLLLIYSYVVLAKKSADFALIACVILVLNITWPVLAGSVMTDAYLVFGLALMMLSFYQIVIMKIKKIAIGYLFFVGLAFCMLAKGPLGIAISGLSIASFLLIRDGFWQGLREFFTKLPIFSGSLLAIAIFLPWYIWAEIRTPGFLNYFIVGEHFSRFLVSGWTGDRYGHAHREPMGMIWVFFLLSTMPWCLYLIIKLATIFKSFSTIKAKFSQFFRDQTNLYFFIWAIVPLIFFSFARNIIIPYSYLSLLPFSIILGYHFYKNNFTEYKIIQIISSISLLFFVILFVSISINPILIGKKSDKKIIQQFVQSNKETLAAYLYEPKHSTYFYSRDKVVILENEEALLNCKNCFIIVGNINAEQQNKISLIAKQNQSVVVVANQVK